MNTGRETSGISKALIGLMAVAAGLSVANIYYNQPVLKNIAASFQLPEAQAGRIPLLTQLGYGLGLFLIVPLGDMINKKKLILSLLICLAFALLLICFSPSLVLVLCASLLVGFLSVAPQVVVPMAASLDKVNRGKTVGVIYTGILVGVLGARVLSGFVASAFNWRYIYGLSAFMMLTIALLLHFYLPEVKPEFKSSYPKLLKSTLYQLKRFSMLRRSTLLGALAFGIFCSFWTTLTFHLSAAPFNYGPAVIGLFGILAIAGALSSPLIGKIADRGGAKRSLIITVSAVFISILLMKIFPHSLTALLIGVVLLDAGVQSTHVTNIARIYTLDDTSLSRINTVYMSLYFLGGALGTFFGIISWNHGGWSLATLQMLVWAAMALTVVLTEKTHKI